jgi:hypothetical protein
VIVRDAGDAWQVVLQPDHAELSAQFARVWAEPTRRFGSVLTATARHDDGWAVWERAPGLDRAGERPRNFLDVEVPLHLAFYRACIAAVTDHDPYAGLLVSMHGAGIYRQRYGRDPGLRITYAGEVGELVEAFVHEQEEGYGARIEELGVADEERWRDYELLQLFDRLSLYFCMRDAEAGEAADLGEYRLRPAGAWRVRLAPFPFAEEPARFTLIRRVVDKRRWTSQEEFRERFRALEPERTEIVVERGESE